MPQDRSPNDEWIAEFYRPIHQAAWMLSGDPWIADDLTQETFLVAVDRWEHFRGDCQASTWLYAILLRIDARRHRQLERARRRVIRWWDRTGREKNMEEDPAAKAAMTAWNESLWSMVSELSLVHRQAVVLRYAQQLSYEEIAEVVGCPPGTVKSRVHGGLERLRRKMKSQTEFQIPPGALSAVPLGRGDCYES